VRVKRGTALQSLSKIERVLEYHQRTKHKPNKYASGPEFLDWELQPNPYRIFDEIEKIPLPLDLSSVNTTYNALYSQTYKSKNSIQKNTFRGDTVHVNKKIDEKIKDLEPHSINIDSLGILLGLSMGLSAHKEYMGDRWSLRCNPSSGNLHPTEAYLISQSINGLKDGVYHYLSESHSLQHRMISENKSQNRETPLLLLALSSISWREAWKYGERAFRYCHLDVGHALAAINYAAACLGWEVKILNSWSSNNIARVCGFDRTEDYGAAEIENADLILSITRCDESAGNYQPESILEWATNGFWQGKANILDKHPIYYWPIITQMEETTEIEATIEIFNSKSSEQFANYPQLPQLPVLSLETENNRSEVQTKRLIYRRRSAQHFDKQSIIGITEFYALVDKCLYRPDTIPWNALSNAEPMIMIFFIHRVNRLNPGMYILSNNVGNSSEDNTQQINRLKRTLNDEFVWTKPKNCPDQLPFYLLSEGNTEKLAKGLSCHQAIASDGAFSVAMIFEFENVIKKHPMNYRKLHWQAGLLGHLLYLEAENLELQGTGIGCFFDDSIHALLGIESMEYQVLYNFTVGGAFNDQRISTLPPYDHLDIEL